MPVDLSAARTNPEFIMKLVDRGRDETPDQIFWHLLEYAVTTGTALC